MNTKAFAVVLSMMFLLSAVIVLADSSDGVYTDPNYRDPPDADFVITVENLPTFTSSSQAFTVSWNVNSADFASDANSAGYLAYLLGQAYNVSPNGPGGNSYEVEGSGGYHNYTATDECLPSWVDWNVDGTGESSVFNLVIRPALQQVAEDTHGSYWIYWAITYPSGLFETTTDTFLVEFDLDVEWDGGVIVPDTYNLYRLNFDYGLGGQGNYYLETRVSTESDQGYCVFSVPDTAPVRDGYVFKGWSTVSGATQTSVGETYTVHIGNADTRVSDTDNGKLYQVTLYAVWEAVEDQVVTLPDFLQDLLDLLSDPWVMILLFVGVFCVALIVRSRKMGEW